MWDTLTVTSVLWCDYKHHYSFIAQNINFNLAIINFNDLQRWDKVKSQVVTDHF